MSQIQLQDLSHHYYQYEEAPLEEDEKTEMLDANAYSFRIVEERDSQGITLRYQHQGINSSVGRESVGFAVAQNNLSNIANESNHNELGIEERKSESVE